MSTINQLYGDLTVPSGLFVDTEDAQRHRQNTERMRARETLKRKDADKHWYEKLERVKRMANHA